MAGFRACLDVIGPKLDPKSQGVAHLYADEPMSDAAPTKRWATNTAANWTVAALSLAALLAAFWAIARRLEVSQRLGGHFPSAFASFALVLAPYWAFGFGAADVLPAGYVRAPRGF